MPHLEAKKTNKKTNTTTASLKIPEIPPLSGDDPPNPFSFLNDKVWIEPEAQLPCHLTYTNERAHKIIAENMHLNRHVREEINGPRYSDSASNSP